MWKDALQCIFDAFALQIFGVRKKWHSFYCTMEFMTDQISACKSAAGYFSVGICILKTSADCFANFSMKYLKKAISDSHVSMQTTQCWLTAQTQKLSNVVNWHTIFENSATNPKCCKMLSTFYQQFQLSLQLETLWGFHLC